MLSVKIRRGIGLRTFARERGVGLVVVMVARADRYDAPWPTSVGEIIDGGGGGSTDAPAERTVGMALFAPLLVGWGALKDAKDTRKEGSGVVVVVVVIIAAAAAAATVRFVGNLLEML